MSIQLYIHWVKIKATRQHIRVVLSLRFGVFSVIFDTSPVFPRDILLCLNFLRFLTFIGVKTKFSPSKPVHPHRFFLFLLFSAHRPVNVACVQVQFERECRNPSNSSFERCENKNIGWLLTGPHLAALLFTLTWLLAKIETD